MPIVVLIALVFFVLASVCGAAFAVTHGLSTWRALRRLQRTAGGGLIEVGRGLEGAEARLSQAGESAARLDRARARLSESIATFKVLMAAAGDARNALRVLAFLRR